MWDARYDRPISCAVVYLSPPIQREAAHEMKLTIGTCIRDMMDEGRHFEMIPEEKLCRLADAMMTRLEERNMSVIREADQIVDPD